MQMNHVLTRRFVVVIGEFNKVKQAKQMVIGINFTPMAIFFHLMLMEFIDFQPMLMNLVLTRRNVDLVLYNGDYDARTIYLLSEKKICNVDYWKDEL